MADQEDTAPISRRHLRAHLEGTTPETTPSENPVEQRPHQRKRATIVLIIAGAVAMVLVGVLLLVLAIKPAASTPVTASSDPSGQSMPKVSVSYSAAPIVKAPFSASDPDQVTPGPTTLASQLPSSLSIPSIDISGAISPSGLDKIGNLDVPTDHIGWWDQSAPLNSSIGTTVLAGHVNTNSGGKGPLGGLADLKKGARVFLTDASGHQAEYKIVALETVEKGQVGTKGADGKYYVDVKNQRQLLLVTCGGEVTGLVPGTSLPIFTHNTVATAIPVTATQ